MQCLDLNHFMNAIMHTYNTMSNIFLFGREQNDRTPKRFYILNGKNIRVVLPKTDP